MIVRYEVTLPDMIEFMRRVVRKRAPRLGWRWKQSLLFAAIVTAGFLAVIEGSNTSKGLAVAVFFVVVFGIVSYLQQLQTAAALKRYVVTRFGPLAPFPFEVEITGAGLTTKQLGEDIRRDWSNVVTISETPGGIEFELRMGGMVFVRDTGFATPSERSEFLRLAREYAHR